MKQLSILTALALLALTTQAPAEDIKSGLQPGKFVGAFYVTKCAGAADDGVAVGKELCYRCKNGGRPQVMVFTRSTKDKNVVKLIQELDKAIADNSEKESAGVRQRIGRRQIRVVFRRERNRQNHQSQERAHRCSQRI